MSPMSWWATLSSQDWSDSPSMASSSSNIAIGRALCALPNCHNARHRDAVTGIEHDFCGRSHAAEYARLNGQQLPAPHGICHVCKLPECNEEVFYDSSDERVHEFCCKTHALEAIDRGLHPPSNRPKQMGGRLHASQQCALPGCTAPKFHDPDTGEVRDYCGRSHARLASQRGTQPPPAALGTPDWFERTWKGTRGSGDYELATLTRAHPKYERIKQQFCASWDQRSSGPTPTVLRVLQVRNPQDVFERYEGYKRQLASASRPVREERRFHATSMACDFGITQSQAPCVDPSCAVCSIAQTAFKLDRAGGGPLMPNLGFLRYGAGLYFSKTSSKSHAYGGGSERRRGPGGSEAHRVMFLCKVALGEALRTASDRLDEAQINTEVRARGGGGAYDSVVGLTTAEGGSLNYEESVVYSEAAAIPSYLIVYKQ